MRVELWAIGATKDAWLREGIAQYVRRIPRLTPFEYRELAPGKVRGRVAAHRSRAAEEEVVLSSLSAADRLILFDEAGKRLDSRAYAKYLEGLQHGGGSRIVLLVGGAYGFGESLYARAEGRVRLSDMTLTHQMARLLAAEQVYRAYSILRGLPYHND